jgi:hypothetical protein
MMDKMNVNLVHMDGIERQPKFKINDPKVKATLPRVQNQWPKGQSLWTKTHPSCECILIHPPMKFFWLASSYRAILSSNLLLTKWTSKCARTLTGCSNYTLINLPNPITRLIFNSLKITKKKNPDHQIQQISLVCNLFFFPLHTYTQSHSTPYAYLY